MENINMMIKRNNSPVPQEVIEHVKDYLAQKELGELIKVVRMSDHPDDDCLYGVIAKKNSKDFDGSYNCWSCWNESTQSLNYGHYNLVSEQACNDVLKEFFHKIYGDNVID